MDSLNSNCRRRLDKERDRTLGPGVASHQRLAFRPGDDAINDILDELVVEGFGGDRQAATVRVRVKWTEEGAAVVLSLRALSDTRERWGEFWSKVDR
jgi:hypothetical protein